MAKKGSKSHSLLYAIYGKTIKGKTNRKGSCQLISVVLKTDYIHLKLDEWMKDLVYQNNSSGTSSPFMVTECLGKFLTGINIRQTAFLRNSLKWNRVPDKATGCLEKLH